MPFFGLLRGSSPSFDDSRPTSCPAASSHGALWSASDACGSASAVPLRWLGALVWVHVEPLCRPLVRLPSSPGEWVVALCGGRDRSGVALVCLCDCSQRHNTSLKLPSSCSLSLVACLALRWSLATLFVVAFELFLLALCIFAPLCFLFIVMWFYVILAG